MSSEGTSTQFTTQEQCSNGGKNRAAKLSPERRKQIATLASHSRKSLEGIPKASHYGKMNIGGIEITCAVLEDGRSVITETSMFKIIGMKPGGRKNVSGAQMPRFLSSQNLQAYIPEALGGVPNSFNILLPMGGKAHAYEAETVTKILDVYLKARRDPENKLSESQIAICISAEIIMTALAKTGIIALIHECTGFQKDREKDALQSLFSKFIAKELQPWVKRFPDQFFSSLKRIYGLEEMKGNPKFFGCLINKFVYKELSPEILEELRRINPVNEKGFRKGTHHQFLTKEIGCPALEKQISKVTNFLSISDSMEEFESYMEKSKR